MMGKLCYFQLAALGLAFRRANGLAQTFRASKAYRWNLREAFAGQRNRT